MLGDMAEQDGDHWLVARFRAGDEAAFTELYARYYPRLVAYCRKRLGDSHLAEEVAQEAFVRAYGTIHRLQPPYRVFPWLTTVARRLAVDAHRRDGRVQPEEHIDLGADPAAEAAWSSELDGEDVRAALGRIRDRHRQVLVMRAWEDLTYDQIAQRIGRPATTVPPLLHRAMTAFRREYLAVTKTDRVAGVVPLLLGLPAALRRLRDRTMQWVANLPEASGLSAPTASVMIGIVAVLTPATLATLGTPATSTASQDPTAKWYAHAHKPSTPDAPRPDAPATELAPTDQRVPDVPPLAGPVGAPLDPPVGEFGTDGPHGPGSDRARETARQMPIYFEYGPVFFGFDHEAVLNDLKATTGGEGGFWSWEVQDWGPRYVEHFQQTVEEEAG